MTYEYTEQQKMELWRCACDPIYYMEQILGMTLSREQKLFVKAMLHDKKVLAVMARQTGKTVLSLAFMFWRSQFQHCKTQLYVSKNFTGVQNATKLWREFYDATPSWMRANLNYCNTRGEFRFDNSGMLCATACGDSTGRGMTLSAVVLDEFDFWSREQQERVMTVIYPCLAAQGSLIIPSTLSHQAESTFKYLLDNKREEFAFVQVPRPMEEMRHCMDEETYKREHLCEYNTRVGRKVLSSR